VNVKAILRLPSLKISFILILNSFLLGVVDQSLLTNLTYIRTGRHTDGHMMMILT
jgi:hypothetical protein